MLGGTVEMKLVNLAGRLACDRVVIKVHMTKQQSHMRIMQ